MNIIHGDDNESAYKHLSELVEAARSSCGEVTIKDASELTPTTLRQLLQPNDLFGNSRFLVIKNLLAGIKSDHRAKLIEIIEKHPDTQIVLFEPKKLSLSNLKSFPKATIKSFMINPVIFKYLDMIRPGNNKSLIMGWNRLIYLKHEPEYVFSMIVRQIRLLIQAKSGSTYLKLSSYPKKMIVSQATNFDLSHLLDLHKLLYHIDKGIKTGQTSLGLNDLMLQFLLRV